MDLKQSYEAEYKDAEHYDKLIVSLASGAFAISIAFIRFIAPDPTPESKPILAAAWILLLLSIFFTLMSLQLSQAGFQRHREILENGGENQFIDSVKGFNWCSLVMFMLGAASLAIFTYKNI